MSGDVFMYYALQNVQSTSGFLSVCSSSLNVIVLNSIMMSCFLDPMVSALTHLRQRYEVPDELAYSSNRTQTLYVLQFLSNAIWPVVVTMLLDEYVLIRVAAILTTHSFPCRNCFRNYLAFSSEQPALCMCYNLCLCR